MTEESPIISIITPVFNQVDFIEKTICSVINQNYPNLEYIIIDGGSTDGTLDIIKKYDKQITKWISEPDKGMYDALNKGFKLSTGEIMAWINSDDILLHNSLFTMQRIFDDLPTVSWVQGICTYMDEKDQIVQTHYGIKYSKIKFLMGDYKFIQQESTFWRRELWEAAGGYIDDRLKLAGDLELWFRFFQKDKLFNVNVPIGAWRRREGQLSVTNMENYIKESNSILNSYSLNLEEIRKIKAIKKFSFLIKIFKKIKVVNFDSLVVRRDNLLGLKNNRIVYSFTDNKFIAVN